MKYDYDKIHSSLWDNHKVTWTASSLFIPIIFTLEGYFLQQYFENFSKFESLEQLFIFIFGALLIQSLAVIWYLIMSSFHNLNENRIIRLKEIERKLHFEDSNNKDSNNKDSNNKDSNEDLLVKQYNCLFKDPKKCKEEDPKCSIMSHLPAFLHIFTLIGYVPLKMPLVMMKRWEIFKDCLDKNKDWHIMKIYLLVVLLLYSLNLIIFIYLSVRMIFGAISGGAPQNNEIVYFTINCANLTLNITK